ncbi:MAG: hypothetical protein H6812_10615 [Phycisphaeraceae bacterium]|nr:hypothetical protein [Phycisphaerales bacterium]MCB9843698.1 hypothetical protein [Phycisphaeraceae bacterium]
MTKKAKKKPANHGKPITKAVVSEVKRLAKANTPTRVIGIKIQRTEASVRNIAGKEGISLKPTNQSPYNRKKAKKK